MSENVLKNHPAFWSRLGFPYDPPLKNSEGKPLVFTENFNKQLETHRDFIQAGVKIHTCILHLGWTGVNEYDYSLTDRVLESLFSVDEDVYYIPRIKLNVPIDWCRSHPEDVFVYEGGPQSAEEIAALVGTDKQDYLGYEAPNGYYRAGDYIDTRANINGLIARQSFSSKAWLTDAGIALERLLDRLENGPYGKRILGYHIAYGTSGETVLWGRINKRYGDHGIGNKKAFYQYGIRKYGDRKALAEAWCQPQINEHNVRIPTKDMRVGKGDSPLAFLRAREQDRIVLDYDRFTSEINANALEYFGKIVKDKTNKLVGAFYGYSLYVDNAAYTGHLALERLLTSPYIDFFAAPKAYERSEAGEPGGEICPAQSINLSKLFVEELDNRTYLATECDEDKRNGLVPDGLRDTIQVLWREFSKNLAHDSGLWWMDLGGGWFASEPIMQEIQTMVAINKLLRQTPHSSQADMLIVYDEISMLSVRESVDLHKGFLREFINETNASGVIADVYRADDLPKLDLTRYKFIVFAYNFYMNKTTRALISSLPEDVTLGFSYAAGVWNEDGFSQNAFEQLTSHRLIWEEDSDYDFPSMHVEPVEGGRKNTVVFEKPYLKSEDIRALASKAGCHVYTQTDGVTLYGDNRFLGVFTKRGGGTLHLKEKGSYRDLISGTVFSDTETIPLPLDEKSALFFIREEQI